MCAAESRRRARRRARAIALVVTGVLLFASAELLAQATTSPKVHGEWKQRKQGPVSADRWPRRQRVYPNDLPAGAGHDIAARACLICHGAMLITQQHKDSTAWAKTIGTMAGWGAPLDTVERETLRGWLTQEYGPRR